MLLFFSLLFVPCLFLLAVIGITVGVDMTALYLSVLKARKEYRENLARQEWMELMARRGSTVWMEQRAQQEIPAQMDETATML